tara:strand:- start:1538 stop:1702 length:165 start_codon:yes stop_codon:yes gene_type:complete
VLLRDVQLQEVHNTHEMLIAMGSVAAVIVLAVAITAAKAQTSLEPRTVGSASYR